MSGSELANGTADLLRLDNASEARSLNQLAMLATRQVRACSGATAALWRDQEPVIMTASHPDLPALIAAQLESGRGPVLEAQIAGEPVSVPDMLTETRWPEFTSAALLCGVRCSITLAYRQSARGAAADGDTVTLSLFSARPRALEAGQLDLAELLVTYAGAVVGNAADYGDAQRIAQQLRDAAESRTLVDQARGMLMQTLGCSPDEAMRWLRRVSQQRNIRVADVAGMIVAGQAVDTLKPRRPRRG
jgi:ANTAR domain